MFGARNFFLTAARAVGDSLWNYVTALFSTTSTNGAQNNTFLDSSTNNFTITRNGNTTQGSFSPYEPTGYWSNYFNGTDAWLSIGSNAAFGMGTGDCTIECWYYPLNSTSGNQVLVDLRTTNTAVPFALAVANGTGAIYAYNGTVYSGTAVTNNAWNHVAFVRSGSGANNCKLYLNGSQVAQFTDANNWGSAQTCAIGRNTAFNGEFAFGYISNVRIVKGTAVYTSAFTPSTVPLTAISGTSLLTCQSNRFRDNSTNNFAITVNGSPSVQAFSPLGNTTPYSTAAVGGSAYLDGSGDYLTAAQNAAFNFGTGAFTVESWVYITANNGTNQRIVGLGDGAIGGGPYTGWALNIISSLSAISWYRYDGTETSLSASYSFALNTWYHVVAVRNGSSNLSIYVNGARIYNNTGASLSYNNVNSNPLYFGAQYDGAGGASWKYFNGYISNARIVAGTAVYDPSLTTLTVPTAPLTAITNTSLLLNSTNAGIFDSAAANDFETVGNAQVSTTQAKFGPTSMYFDGSGDWLASPAVANLSFGTGNFTIEMWMYHGTGAYVTAQPVLLQNWASTWGANEWSLHADHNSTTAGKFSFWVNNSASGSPLLVSTSTSRTSTWNHIAVVRYGSTFSMFVNGNLEATATFSGSLDGGGSWPIYVGGPQLAYDGYIDDLRITNGYARYWYNFPVPTSAFPVQYAPEVPSPNDPLFDYVTMLLPGNGTNGAQNNTFLDSSANNYTITRNGNSTQGAFTPYGPNWSNYLNSGDSFAFTQITQGSTWTIECWFNINASGNNLLTYQASGGDFWLRVSASAIEYSFAPTTRSFSFTATPGVWYHLALVNNASTLTCYINGSQVGTSQGGPSTSYVSKLGGYGSNLFAGYISNLRITNTAVYTAAFTPSTVPLTAITGTQLLIGQSNRFVDNSSNAYALTVGGSPSVQRFSPFNPPASYSAATNGGSGYFDGSGDKLLVATNSNMTLGTNDFTVELWAYPLALSGSRCFTTQADPSFDQNGYWIGSNGTGLYWLVGDGTWALLRTVGTLTLNAWNHIALTRSGTTFRAFINGVLVDTQTSSVSLTNANNNVSIGGRDAGAVQYSNSYISGYRVLNGTCLYTATFTPPTTPPTVITNTQLLTNFTNAGVIDNAMMNDLETVGNAQISTSVSKFGGGSMAFDGNGDYLLLQNTLGLQFGSNNFTIEFWLNLVARDTSGACVFANYNSFTTGALSFFAGHASASATKYQVACNGTFPAIQSSISVTYNQWDHFAIVRSGNTLTLYINGVADGTFNMTGISVNGVGSSWIIGAALDALTSYELNGYIDDLRITKGIARYVQPFTPPTQAFQTQ